MSHCRFCDQLLKHEFVDLVNSPPSNSFIKTEALNEPEVFFPLKLFVCDKCFLVQMEEFKSATDIFNSDYAYFSSYSRSWLEHCKRYTEMAMDRFKLGKISKVVELASNDGYLLQFFKEKGIQVLGVEPTRSTAQVAIDKGIETMIRFFGCKCADDLIRERGKADLVVANNVLAHVPDINDFVGGIKILLSENGTFTGEFPHLYQLIAKKQFDTIYHEHFSYFSLHTISAIFAKAGIPIFDVEELPTHGGSLRIYADHGQSSKPTARMLKVLEMEKSAQMQKLEYYSGFQKVPVEIKHALLRFLLDAKGKGKKIAAYGAAAKGNTLFNFCGVRRDLVDYVVDASPYKQGRLMPGSHIPIVNEAKLKETKPDYVILLPWNLKTELVEQLSYIREWNAKFVIALPELEIF